MTTLNLNTLAEQTLGEAATASSGRSARTVYGGQARSLHQTVVGVRAGQAMSEHDSPGEATVQVLRGHVRVVAGERGWEGRPGDVIVVPPLRHRLEALEDSAVLLTVSKH